MRSRAYRGCELLRPSPTGPARPSHPAPDNVREQVADEGRLPCRHRNSPCQSRHRPSHGRPPTSWIPNGMCRRIPGRRSVPCMQTPRFARWVTLMSERGTHDARRTPFPRAEQRTCNAEFRAICNQTNSLTLSLKIDLMICPVGLAADQRLRQTDGLLRRRAGGIGGSKGSTTASTIAGRCDENAASRPAVLLRAARTGIRRRHKPRQTSRSRSGEAPPRIPDCPGKSSAPI